MLNLNNCCHHNIFICFPLFIRNGSVIVDLTIISNSEGAMLELLIAAVKYGKIGSFTVDNDFLICNDGKLPLSRRRPLSHRNLSIDLQSKSMDWFLYDNSLSLERVNR